MSEIVSLFTIFSPHLSATTLRHLDTLKQVQSLLKTVLVHYCGFHTDSILSA